MAKDKTCKACGGTDFQSSNDGSLVCTSCGSVLEAANIVSEITFGGDSSVVGTFVSATRRTNSGYRTLGRDSRAFSLDNARRRLEEIANSLKMKPHHVDSAQRSYELAMEHNFTKGRKTHLVAASCLYIVCRRERTPHLLIDFSEVLHINIFVLAHTFLELVKLLNIHLPIVDPSLFIPKFAHNLEFGDQVSTVIETANKLVARMNRDWLSVGRKPSGICGASLYIASKIHGFKRSMKEIVRIVKIGESTLVTRLEEFSQTPSASLKPSEFDSFDIEVECNPPAFERARQKETLAHIKKQQKKKNKKKSNRKYLLMKVGKKVIRTKKKKSIDENGQEIIEGEEILDDDDDDEINGNDEIEEEEIDDLIDNGEFDDIEDDDDDDDTSDSDSDENSDSDEYSEEEEESDTEEKKKKVKKEKSSSDEDEEDEQDKKEKENVKIKLEERITAEIENQIKLNTLKGEDIENLENAPSTLEQELINSEKKNEEQLNKKRKLDDINNNNSQKKSQQLSQQLSQSSRASTLTSITVDPSIFNPNDTLENLDNDSDLETYIERDKEEIRKKDIIWKELNHEWIVKNEEREREMEEDRLAGRPPRKRKVVNKKTAESAAQAAEEELKKRTRNAKLIEQLGFKNLNFIYPSAATIPSALPTPIESSVGGQNNRQPQPAESYEDMVEPEEHGGSLISQSYNHNQYDDDDY